MGRKKFQSVILKIVLFFGALLFVGCNATKKTFEVRYEKVWKEMIKSQAWKDALKKDGINSVGNTDFYVTTDQDVLVDEKFTDNRLSEDAFVHKYDFLVSRAYAKIIAEAEAADGRLEREYLNWNAKNELNQGKEDKVFRQQLVTVNNRYSAHRKMLEGLKSWNIFSEFGSDDLEFFKDEHSAEVRQMLQNGSEENNVVSFLVYQLADLYHFEE